MRWRVKERLRGSHRACWHIAICIATISYRMVCVLLHQSVVAVQQKLKTNTCWIVVWVFSCATRQHRWYMMLEYHILFTHISYRCWLVIERKWVLRCPYNERYVTWHMKDMQGSWLLFLTLLLSVLLRLFSMPSTFDFAQTNIYPYPYIPVMSCWKA